MTPDPKPDRRIIDKLLMRALHAQWRECALCDEHRGRLSIHHVWKHPRHDLRENTVMLCGDGVRGCHGKIEAGDHETRRQLGEHILDERPDVFAFLVEMTGGEEQAKAWMERHLHVAIADS